MAAKASGYTERHRAIQSRKPALPDPSLLTDKASYIVYLESQLERVSAACLTVSTFADRLSDSSNGLCRLEEKLMNVARLVSCTQQYCESAVEEINLRLAALEGQIKQGPERDGELQAQLSAATGRIDAKLSQIDGQVAGSLASAIEEQCHTCLLEVQTQVKAATGRLGELERRVRHVDCKASQAAVTEQQVASLAARVAGVEECVQHLAEAEAGTGKALRSAEQGLGQLRATVVALSARPDNPDSGASRGQGMPGARGAMSGQQEVARAVAAAQATADASAAASPTHALAARVLQEAQQALEVGSHPSAVLRTAEGFVGGVAEQLGVCRETCDAAAVETRGSMAGTLKEVQSSLHSLCELLGHENAGGSGEMAPAGRPHTRLAAAAGASEVAARPRRPWHAAGLAGEKGSVLGAAASAGRRHRLQALYADLRGGGGGAVGDRKE